MQRENHKPSVWYKRLKWLLASQCKVLQRCCQYNIYHLDHVLLSQINCNAPQASDKWMNQQWHQSRSPHRTPRVPLGTHHMLAGSPQCHLVPYTFVKLNHSDFFRHKIHHIGSPDMLFPHPVGHPSLSLG